MSDHKDFPTTSTVIARLKKRNQSDPNAAFPTMLHRMLSDIEELSKTEPGMAKLTTIISWQDHGRAFKLHDKKKFISIIMPAFFVRLKYTSFIRQLNTYNFKRISEEGEDKGALYHENFIKEMPELTARIPKMKKRKSNAGTGSVSEGGSSKSLPRTVSTDMTMRPQQHQPPQPNRRPSIVSARSSPQMQQKVEPRVNSLKNLILEQNIMRQQQQQQQQQQSQMSSMMSHGALNGNALFNHNNNMMNNMSMGMGMTAPMCNPGFPQIMMDATQQPPMFVPQTSQTFFNNSNNNGCWMGNNNNQDLPVHNINQVVEDNSNSLQRLLDMAETTDDSPFDISLDPFSGDEDDQFEPVPISPLLDNDSHRDDMNALFTSECGFGDEF